VLCTLPSMGYERSAQDGSGVGRDNADLLVHSASPWEDGSNAPCAPNAPSGLAPAEHYLKAVLREIKSSPAYKGGGLIAITFDQAAQSGPNADSSSCCIYPRYPNLPASTPTSGTGSTSTTTTTAGTTPTTTTGTTPTTTTSPTTTTTTSTTSTTPAGGGGVTSPTGGGGQVGLLLISKWVTPGTLDTIDYFNHFSLLASIEGLFGLKRLGYATNTAVQSIPAADFSGKGP
jgi:hypothetical protein